MTTTLEYSLISSNMDIGEPALLLLGELKKFPEEKPYNASKQFDTTHTTKYRILPINCSNTATISVRSNFCSWISTYKSIFSKVKRKTEAIVQFTI